MLDSLLSWDDLEEDVPVKSAVNQDIALKAAASLATLDTTEAQRELDEQGAAIKYNQALRDSGLSPSGVSDKSPIHNDPKAFTPTELKVNNHAILERAKQIVVTMDAHLQSGGRVNVAEKYLLNCQADLNQLVPFKYNWAWSLYLTSCENHWMPAEIGMEKAFEELALVKRGTPRKMMIRFYFNYLQRNHAYGSDVLLNCYRIITNPECRQYILRQGFENAAVIHAMTDLNDIFQLDRMEYGGQNLSAGQWGIDGWTFKNRYRLGVELTSMARDFTATTEGAEKTSEFLENLVYLYGYINWIMQVVPMYQMLTSFDDEAKLRENPSLMANMKVLVGRLLKDIQAQTKFIELFLSTAFEENPHVLNDEFKARVHANFKRIFDAELDLAGTLANNDHDTLDCMGLVKYFSNKFLSSIGIGDAFPTVTLNERNTWFVEFVNSLQPHVNFEAGLSGNGGSLGW